ncbi:MAG TPA: right-handed parallel beta-helix repeat-containing protein, partial [bacterium]|nr:right-handed parallel beta-helix repeat-containing protein [bacterium]
YIYEDGNDYGIGTVTRVVSINGRLISVDPELLDSYRVRNQAVARHIFNVFCANGVSNLTIRNLQVIGSLKKSPTISSWVGNSLFFLDGQNITVSQVSVEDAPADGIYIGAHDGVRVSQCRLKNIAQRAIHLAGHRGSGRMRGAIEGNTISYAGDYGVYFCDNCRGLIVKGNIISDIGVYQGAGGTIRTQEAAPVDARRFRFLRQLLPAYTRPAGIGGIGAGGDADNIIAENIIYRVKGTGIAFQRWTTENRPGRNMTVAGNVIFDIFGPGIFLYGANGVLVSGNNISSSQTGVVVKKSIFCQLQGNLIRTARTGIQIYSLMPDLWTEKNVIVNNTLVDCQSSIVQNYFCRNNLIRDNYNFQSQ